MKSKLRYIIVTAIMLLTLPNINFGQAPALGTAANFALFTSVGAVTNSGTSYLTHITGNVGTNSDPTTPGFGNVDGNMHYVSDPASTQCAADLLIANNQLNSTVATFFPANLLGNGQILVPGVYSISGATTLNLDLNLDAQGDPDAEFIIKIQGTFGANTNSKVNLLNGALACNVFWKIDGAVSMGTGTFMRGTIISNAAISMSTGDTLEGRALTTNGAVGVSGVLIYTPIGCGSPVLTGPAAPALGSAECYGIFTSDGPVVDDGASFVTGDIGTNNGSVTGYNPLNVDGTIHNGQDPSTIQCASDLGVAYAYINTLQEDIELLFPAQFGHNLVLTPHTYLMNGAVTFTDSLYLNAQGNANAVFIIKVYGALSTSTYSKVILINGAQAKNVYWMVNGAVSINDYSVFNGTFVSAGAIDLKTGVELNGRAFTTVGAINTYAITNVIPSGNAGAAGTITGSDSVCKGQSGVIYSVSEISGASGYNWTLPSGAIITAGANTDSITVDFSSVAVSGNITVQGTSNCGDGAVSANFAVTVSESPTVNGVSNQTVCYNEPTSSVMFSGAVAGTTYNWTNDNTSVGLAASGTGDINSFTAINTGSSASVATVTVTPSANGCDGTPTSFTITVNPAPNVNGVSNQTVCHNAATSAITFSGAVAGTTYNWTNDNTSIGLGASGSGDINSFTAMNTGTSASIATITVTPSANGCDGTPTSFLITVNPAPTVDSVPDQTICHDAVTSAITFSGAIAGTTYNWTNDNTSIGLAASGSGNINSFTAINATTSAVTAIITVTPTADGCDGSPSTLSIVVNNCDCNAQVPEGFSPNGDGINDLFVIRGIENCPGSLVIFNRWGDQLFEASPYQNTWDGKSTTGITVGGDELPTGTYFYVLDLGNGSEILKGTIYLIK